MITVAEQTFPKRGACGRVYATRADWQRLPFLGDQFTEDETGRYRSEMRNCDACKSTIAIEELLAPQIAAP